MTTASALKAWATRRARGDSSAPAKLAHRTMMRARAREVGAVMFTTPRVVLAIIDPALRAWALAFVRFVRGQGERPEWVDDPRRRAVELRLARECGIADPAGFLYGAELLRGRRKRKFRGVFRGVAGQLAEDRARMSYGGWHG